MRYEDGVIAVEMTLTKPARPASESLPEFSRRYRAELALARGADVVFQLREWSKTGRLVLLSATRDIEHSGARVLRDVILGADGS